MLAELVRSRPGGRAATPARSAPESGYAARVRLTALRDELRVIAARGAKRSRWGEPALFFFDRQRQLDLETARPIVSAVDPLRERIAHETASLCESVDERQAARGVQGLREAAAVVPAAKPLAELLAVPDDETVLVLHPQRRLGYRLSVRGVATINQFQVLMQASLEEPMPSRFVRACADAVPCIPAGVPMVVNLPYQCVRPEALRQDGSLPDGFAGCDHWLWGRYPLAAAPRIDGERVILLGEPAYPQMWDVERAFPAMQASVEFQSALNPFQVADRLSRIAGAVVPVQTAQVRQTALAAAA